MGFTIQHGGAGGPGLGEALNQAGRNYLAGRQVADEEKRTQQYIDAANRALEEHEAKRQAAGAYGSAQAEMALPQGPAVQPQGPGSVEPEDAIHAGTGTADWRDPATLQRDLERVKALRPTFGNTPEGNAAFGEFAKERGDFYKNEIAKIQYHDTVNQMHDSWVKMAQTPAGQEQAPLVEQMFKMLDLATDAPAEDRLRLLGQVAQEFGRVQVAGAKQHQQQLDFEETSKALLGALGQAQPGSKAAARLTQTYALYAQGLMSERSALRVMANAHLDTVDLPVGNDENGNPIVAPVAPEVAAKINAQNMQKDAQIQSLMERLKIVEAGKSERANNSNATRLAGIELTREGIAGEGTANRASREGIADQADATKRDLGEGKGAQKPPTDAAVISLAKTLVPVSRLGMPSREVNEQDIAKAEKILAERRKAAGAPANAPDRGAMLGELKGAVGDRAKLEELFKKYGVDPETLTPDEIKAIRGG